MYSLAPSEEVSEIFVTIFEFELGIDVFECVFVLVGVHIDVHRCPLGGVLDEWEFGAPLFLVLKCLRDSIVHPWDVVI